MAETENVVGMLYQALSRRVGQEARDRLAVGAHVFNNTVACHSGSNSKPGLGIYMIALFAAGSEACLFASTYNPKPSFPKGEYYSH
ncbi:MAG: hypothetical protein WC254_01130 [Candidatus Woesearchaeota archaeon]|jgi:hypothetical protein